MIYTIDKQLEEYVRPTHYCDADAPEVITKARNLAEDYRRSERKWGNFLLRSINPSRCCTQAYVRPASSGVFIM